MTRKWTEEQKVAQARKISAWKPWKYSTGPRTDEGKARSAENRALSLEATRQRAKNSKREYQKALDELERITGKRNLSGIDSFQPDQLQQILKMCL
jgi:hypothetical protein